MNPLDVIRAKRDGETLAPDAIADFVVAVASGAVSDPQAAAFAMAVCINGMTREERVALTLAMRDSGEVMCWDLPGPVVDKHSTGGVGDNVSLILAPALAACGAYVPMISGRGLGHTGGTLDKLEAIAGYDTAPDPERFRKVVAREGCAIIGQTGDLAPADKRLYAVRDVTGTVESVDLITASILSKKLAAGLDALVLDVKFGSGAFMSELSEAEALACSLVGVANGAECRTSALLTDMNEPLASAMGNALEVANACAFLTGHEVDGRLWDVVAALGGEALALAGLAPDADAGGARISDALQTGRAAERFASMAAALGGPTDFVERWVDYLPAAPVVREVVSETDGFIAAIDGRALGEAVIDLGGGRRQVSDAIDPAVGLDQIQGIGAAVSAGDPLVRVHAASEDAADRAAAIVRGAYLIRGEVHEVGALIAARIGAETS